MAKAPKIPRKATTAIPEGSPEPSPAAAEATRVNEQGTPGPPQGEQLVDEVLIMDVESEPGENGRGWGETHSQMAMEELHQWLANGEEAAATRRGPSRPDPPPAALSGLRGRGYRVLAHICEAEWCEAQFTE